MKPKRWYQKRLGKYFDEHYDLYEDITFIKKKIKLEIRS